MNDTTKKDFLTEIKIENSIETIEKLLDTEIFNIDTKTFRDVGNDPTIMENIKNPFRKSAVVEILINLRSLLYKCEHIGKKRVNFDDGIIKMKYKVEYRGKIEEKEIKDVTDAVEYMRNAVCHIDDDEKRLVGKMILDSNFLFNNNDVGFNIGPQTLYIKKHVVCSVEEAKKILSKYLDRYNRMKEQKDFTDRLMDHVQNLIGKNKK